jgi:hypothetical protein
MANHVLIAHRWIFAFSRSGKLRREDGLPTGLCDRKNSAMLFRFRKKPTARASIVQPWKECRSKGRLLNSDQDPAELHSGMLKSDQRFDFRADLFWPACRARGEGLRPVPGRTPTTYSDSQNTYRLLSPLFVLQESMRSRKHELEALFSAKRSGC